MSEENDTEEVPTPAKDGSRVYRSRRFVLAVGFYLGLTVGLFTDKVDGANYVLGIGAVLAGYGFTRSKLANKE